MLDTYRTAPGTTFNDALLDELPIAYLDQWVCWHFEQRRGEPKPTKPPRNPRTGAYAKTTDPSTWASLGRAADRARREGWGVGFVFTAPDPYCGIDFDHVIDAAGTLAPWAATRIRRLDTYSEVSPSGDGVKCIGMATARHNGRRTFADGSACEVYDRSRFFTLTGRAIHSPDVIAPCQAELDRIVAHLWPPTPPPPPSPRRPLAFSDAEVIERAHRARNGAHFAALWAGDWRGRYGSQSEADLALASLLSFWCDGDQARVDALFRQSGLCRPKWDRADYRAATLARACTPTRTA